MLKKSLLFGILFVFIAGCGSSDDYDPVIQLERDLAAIDQYVAEQGLTVEIDESGIRYVINTAGNGNFPQAGEIVRVYYEVFLLNGTFVDTNIEQTARDNNVYNEQRNYTPFQFRIAGGGVIEGFDIGTRLLSLGGQGTFLLPSTLAYKNSGSGSGSVPANANLLFNIALVEID
jgi:FKBP-type peptidyl-prolyl cis-trans isomerase FkpA